MGDQELVGTSHPATCTVCGALAQQVMVQQATAGVVSACYECSGCGSLIRKPARLLASTEYIPHNAHVCRDTFLGYGAGRKLSELLSEPGICVVSINKNAGFLTRMFMDSDYDVRTLRYVEEQRYVGVELNDYSYRAIAAEDRLAGRIFVVFEGLGICKDPQMMLEVLASQQPRCIVLVLDVYKGQDLTWPPLRNAHTRTQLFLSHQALHQLATDINYTLYAAENLYVLTREPLNNQDNRFVKLLTAIQSSTENDFSGYLASARRRQRRGEGMAQTSHAESKRVFLRGPQDSKLYIDCLFFQMANSGIARVWNEVFRVWSRKHAEQVVLLDRGGDIQDFGLQRIPFNRFDFADIAGETRALSWFLLRKGAYRFASTYYSFSEVLPIRAVVYDMIPENLSFDKNDPQWVLKKLYLERSESLLAISRQTMVDAIKYFPHIADNGCFVYPGISDLFKPVSPQQRRSFRKKLGVTARYLVVVPCALGGYKDGITALRALDRLGMAKDVEVICTVPLQGQEKLIESLGTIKVRSLRFSDQDYADLIASSDLVVWTPWMEGLGLPPIEAISCHTNVVVARTPINVELYGDTLSYAEPGNVESFSRAIETALNNGISSTLIEQVQPYLSIENFADRLFEFLYQ